MRDEFPDGFVPKSPNEDDPSIDASEVQTPEEELLGKIGMEELIKKTEGEKFINIDDTPVGNTVTVRTANTTYKIEHRPDGFYISGSSKYCPEPIKVTIAGCTWGGSMIKPGIIQEGMKLEYYIPGRGKPKITTSVIESISDDGAISVAA